MKRHWCAKWVQMCVAVNHYKVTDTFKCSRGERKRMDWLNRFTIPLSSLDSFFSCLGLITTHTHLTLLFHLHHNYCGKDWEQSKAQDMRPSTSNEPHMHTCAQAHIDTHKHISHNNCNAIYIFCLKPLGIFPNPLPSPGASCFWDWFHLFNDGCANDPSHTADGVTDTTASLEWGLDVGLVSKG